MDFKVGFVENYDLNDALDVIFNEEDLEQVVQQLTDPEMKLISSLHLIVAQL